MLHSSNRPAIAFAAHARQMHPEAPEFESNDGVFSIPAHAHETNIAASLSLIWSGYSRDGYGVETCVRNYSVLSQLPQGGFMVRDYEHIGPATKHENPTGLHEGGETERLFVKGETRVASKAYGLKILQDISGMYMAIADLENRKLMPLLTRLRDERSIFTAYGATIHSGNMLTVVEGSLRKPAHEPKEAFVDMAKPSAPMAGLR